MAHGSARRPTGTDGLLQIEDCLDDAGHIVLPSNTTLISLIDHNIANVGDTAAYRYVDFTSSEDGYVTELTWSRLGVRMQAVAGELQGVISRGDRVAILAPQGLDYVVGFFATVKAGGIAVPLFAPELPGHAERLETALRDCTPSVVLTTAAALGAVKQFLAGLTGIRMPRVVVVDEVADSAAEAFTHVDLDVDGISHLQYTSGATRPPVGVEITHRAVGTNLTQMILSIDMLEQNTHGVSWLPLYHDMGLSMIGFPTVYGGHSTLMSPTAFIRRPQRWIQVISNGCREGRVVTAAPNFAYEWAAQRGVPKAGEDIDLGNVVLIIGSEPVSIDAIKAFDKAFSPFGLPPTAFKPSYGIAEATLFVSNIAPSAEPTVVYFDREQLAAGQAVPVAADAPGAVAQVGCGQLARSLWGVIVEPDTGDELPDGHVGEIWLQGDNVGRGYWGRPEDTRRTFHARLRSTLQTDSHALGANTEGSWLRTADLGVYLAGELYVTGRIADLLTIDGRNHYPQDIEATAADASPIIRRGYLTAFTVPSSRGPNDEGPNAQIVRDGVDMAGDRLVIVAERASGTSRLDPEQAIETIRAAVEGQYGVPVSDVRLLPAGSIPRTTSGKLARRACRRQYVDGVLGTH